MKYGLLMHKPTTNLGDDIQTYANMKLLPHVDYIINRENIYKFKPEDEKPIAVVMAAWWMWNKWCWPPSKFIYPLFVGFHYSDNKAAKQAGCPVGYRFLTGLGKKYLNSYGPIGCRDYYTRDNLRKIGIKADFTGCITLALPKQKRIKPEKEYVCLVDVAKPIEKKVRKQLENTDIEVKVITHNVLMADQLAASFEQRMDKAEELLTLYQNAKCVITRRLHAALPCLAMDVPVLLAMKNPQSIRFNPYAEWLNYCIPIQYVNGEYEYDITNPPANPTVYREYRDKIIKSVEDFVEKCESLGDVAADDIDRLKKSSRSIAIWRNINMRKTAAIWEKELNGDLTDNEIKKNNELKAQIRENRFKPRTQNKTYDKLMLRYLSQARRIFDSPEKKAERKRAREAEKKAQQEALQNTQK
ncbi:MAG: polysaccharide pyruvyl transferase family protein [Ruminococcus sp.]|nr:polysaccharide pyruvyl transferase family protein [Ruminococcus sp.]